MQIRFQNSPVETSKMNTTELRANFLIQDLMQQDQINLVYTHYDRMIVGGVVPGKNKIDLLMKEN
jgi:4-deoxy-L-threo-5-hexosulose-uronate ketol-isomerase